MAIPLQPIQHRGSTDEAQIPAAIIQSHPNSPTLAAKNPESVTDAETVPQLSLKGLVILCLLRFSSAWNERSIAFAVYLFLVIVFPSTLVPASAFGLTTTASGILFSNFVGTLVDKYRHKRLAVVRYATSIQKLCIALIYALFIVLLFFARPSTGPSNDLGKEQIMKNGILSGMIILGCLLKVSTVCSTLCVEREWPSVISKGSSERLAKMNTWLRRVDLICDLVSPLFVSGLAAGVSYTFAAAFLAGMAVVSFVLEMVLTGIAFSHFPELRDVQSSGNESPSSPEGDSQVQDGYHAHRSGVLHLSLRKIWRKASTTFRDFVHDFTEFSKLPVFWTSLSIASIYLTVLSFDGTMLTFLKNTLNYSDPFLAGQRGVSTVAGLAGTLLFPVFMHRIGLIRTGSWAIWFEFACLVPVVVSLYLGTPHSLSPMTPPAWAATMLFGGMALSRIGLWMFDLSQIQILQESLESHPRRNRLTSIQFILQDVFDMAKYGITLGLSKPAQFRWAGLISAISVFTGGCLYVFGYARRVRGHVAPHWGWLRKFKVV